jgi:glycosyltransferase involved in cell wall biosynthesis
MPDVLHTLGENWLVDPGDPEALADRLQGLRDNDLVGQAGVGARALYDSRYSPPVGLAGLEDAYRHARGEDSARDGPNR